MSATFAVTLMRAHAGDVWHVVEDGHALCGWRAPADVKVEIGLDPRVVAHRGKRVCGLCRRRIR